MKINYQVSREELNKEVQNLLEKVNSDYKINISEHELRNLIDVKEETYLFNLVLNYNWLIEEKKKDAYNDLTNAIYEEYIETY